MTRAERVETAVAMRSQGKTTKEIAAELGVSGSCVRDLISDPDRSKAKERRLRYAGVCEDCGAKTDGSGGYGKAPRWCRNCTPAHKRLWTRENVIEAIQKWAREHNGVPPTSRDWFFADKDAGRPGATSVYNRGGERLRSAPFNSWADAVEAAGFPRPISGVYGDREKWSQELIVEAVKRWAAKHGRPPKSREWKNAELGRPTHGTVVNHFPFWADAIETAGFPRPRGGRTRG